MLSEFDMLSVDDVELALEAWEGWQEAGARAQQEQR